MSLPACPITVSEPWWPSSSSLSGPPVLLGLRVSAPPVLLWLALSSTFHRIPLTAGQPLWLTFSPPPAVRGPSPGPHCSPERLEAHRSPGSVPRVRAGVGTASAAASTAREISFRRMTLCVGAGAIAPEVGALTMARFAIDDLEHPIVQAPLAGGPSTPELAAAVGEAGGLGFLGAGYKTPDGVREDVAALRALTSRPFAVNVFAPPGPPGDAAQVARYADALRAAG